MNDWDTFLRIYDRCMRFGTISDDELERVTSMLAELRPETLVLLMVKRIEGRLAETARASEEDEQP